MRILVCYHDPRNADALLALASAHAQAFDSSVYVLTSMYGGEVEEMGKRKREKIWDSVEEAEQKLEYVRSIFKKDDIPCITHLSLRGLSPGEDIISYARENDIEEIIIGIRKRSRVDKLVFGSTAQYVILNAPCPVVTLR